MNSRAPGPEREAPERPVSSAVPAVVAAGEGRASRAVYGRNKALLELGGRPLLARVVAVLQRVPEVSEVWVVGRVSDLAPILEDPDLQAELRKPLVLVPQFRNLIENAWESYRRILPGAPPEGRDPESDADRDLSLLYLSSDLPFATPQEISSFIQKGLATGCEYALGLVPEEAMTDFYARAPGEVGIEMAYFNISEGRFRQSNLHLVKPARLRNRQRIQDMYEHRYQKQLGNALSLAWKMATEKGGGLWMIWYYARMHLAGVADRHGWRNLADWLRRSVTFARLERGCSNLLGTHYRFVVTDVGGAAVDIDNESDFESAAAMLEPWSKSQARRAEELLGPLPLPELAGADPGLRVWQGPGKASGAGEREQEEGT